MDLKGGGFPVTLFFIQGSETMNKLLVLCLLFVSSASLAHPSFDKTTATAGSIFKADMLVTHGCGDSPTIRIVMEVQEDVLGITPRVKPGWEISVVESELSEPRTMWGVERTKYTSQLIWSGGSLSSDYFDVFSFVLALPHEPQTLYFPTTQYCVEGVDAYTTVPDAANPGEQHENLAPSIHLEKAGTGSSH